MFINISLRLTNNFYKLLAIGLSIAYGFQLFLCMLMQIFLSGCKSASDMAFLLVHIQHQPDLLCQSGIDLYQAVSTVLMFGCL